MRNHRIEYFIDGMCSCLDVSRSGYYAWLHRKPSQRYQNRQHLERRIIGSTHCLTGINSVMGHNDPGDKPRRRRHLKTIAASLRCQDRWPKLYKFKVTTRSKYHLAVFDNLLNQDFSATTPNQKGGGTTSPTCGLRTVGCI